MTNYGKELLQGNLQNSLTTEYKKQKKGIKDFYQWIFAKAGLEIIDGIHVTYRDANLKKKCTSCDICIHRGKFVQIVHVFHWEGIKDINCNM